MIPFPHWPRERPTHAQIAVRAYEIWKHDYGDQDTTHEVEVQIWIRAEAQLMHSWHMHRPPGEM